MKKNKKSVSLKNTKSFLGNPPALANTTFFVPAANLNSNDGIFTDLHDNPSNFSSSNQDPNWGFDISNKLFAQSDKKKIFSDDKFKNMISYNQDMYRGDLMSDYYVPVENYYGVEREVSPVLSEVDFPRYQSDVDLQPVSVGIAPVDANYFAPSRVYSDTFMNADVLQQAQQSGSDFFQNAGVSAVTRYKEGDFVPRYESDVDLQSVSVGRGYADGIYLPDMEVREIFRPSGYEEAEKVLSSRLNEYGQAAPPEAIISSDEELIKLIGQEEFDRLVAQKYGSAVLSNPEVKPAVDPFTDTNNVETASIQPTTVEEDKKAKKSFNWLPIVLVVAAVGGYMYYNRKK